MLGNIYVTKHYSTEKLKLGSDVHHGLVHSGYFPVFVCGRVVTAVTLTWLAGFQVVHVLCVC